MIKEIFNNNKLVTLFHTTNEELAMSIIKYGFLITDSVDKTTDEVGPTIFRFWHRYRKDYGTHCVIIQAPRKYTLEYIEDKKEFLEATRALIEIDESFENVKFEGLIPKRFIRGYIINNKFIDLKKII